MSLDEEYPKFKRDRAARLRALLRHDPELTAAESADMALIVNVMADRALELDEIFRRLVDEEHSLAEIGELLIAFQLTNEQMRGASDAIEKKLFDIGDRLKALPTSDRATPKRRTANPGKKALNGSSQAPARSRKPARRSSPPTRSAE